MASAMLARDSWTGSPRLSVGLSDDWNEAEMELKERSCDTDCQDYSPQFVVAVWSWGQAHFGKAARTMSIVELAEYWYEFA